MYNAAVAGSTTEPAPIAISGTSSHSIYSVPKKLMGIITAIGEFKDFYTTIVTGFDNIPADLRVL